MRTICYNIYMCRGWPQEAAYVELKSNVGPDLFANALRKYEPDVINLSEVPGETFTRDLAERLAMQAVFFSSPERCNGAIITGLEVLESRNCPLQKGKRQEDLFTRHWGRAVLQTGSEDIVVHSIHLFPDAQSKMHSEEVEEIIKVVQADMTSYRSVLVQGDLNHEPKNGAYERWRETGLVDAFAAAGSGPGETIKANQPDGRIDYILASRPLSLSLRECRVLRDTPFRTKPGDPGSWSLSDHLPVTAVFD